MDKVDQEPPAIAPGSVVWDVTEEEADELTLIIQAKSGPGKLNWNPAQVTRARPCCWKCTPNYPLMLACKLCGNKRCPHATDHDLACTGSNEPGQAGSRYRRSDSE